MALNLMNACELLIFEGVGSCIFPDVPDDPASLYPDDFVAQAAAEGLIKGYGAPAARTR